MTMTLTEEIHGSVKKIKATWVEASGAATATTTNRYTGLCQLLTTIPDGSTAPAANYDLTVLDQSSVDVLAGGGANRHSANTEQVKAASLGGVVNDTLKFSIANAGSSSGAGTVYLLIR
jgi:hypothetical protein